MTPSDPQRNESSGIDWKHVRAAGKAEWKSSREQSKPLRGLGTDLSAAILYQVLILVFGVLGFLVGAYFGGGSGMLFGALIGGAIGAILCRTVLWIIAISGIRRMNKR